MALFTPHIAIDLGTVNVLVHDQSRGVVLQEPSVVAVREDGNKTIIVEVGRAAKEMYGRTPEEIEVMRPLRDGVVLAGPLVVRLRRSLCNRAPVRRQHGRHPGRCIGDLHADRRCGSCSN